MQFDPTIIDDHVRRLLEQHVPGFDPADIEIVDTLPASRGLAGAQRVTFLTAVKGYAVLAFSYIGKPTRVVYMALILALGHYEGVRVMYAGGSGKSLPAAVELAAAAHSIATEWIDASADHGPQIPFKPSPFRKGPTYPVVMVTISGSTNTNNAATVSMSTNAASTT